MKAQSLLDICQSWAHDNMMSFNTSKCKVMVLYGPSTDTSLKLFNDNLEIVYSYKYLGVTLTAKRITNFFKTHFSLMLEKARIRVATIRRYGFHKDGLRLASQLDYTSCSLDLFLSIAHRLSLTRGIVNKCLQKFRQASQKSYNNSRRAL